MRHDLDAGNQGGLEQLDPRRHRNVSQHPVDPVPHLEIILERLNVDIRRPLLQGFTNDLVDELDHRGLGVIRVQDRRLLLQIAGRWQIPAALQNLVEGFRPHAVTAAQTVQHRPPGSQHPAGLPLPKSRQGLAAQMIKRIETQDGQGLALPRRDRQEPMPERDPGRELFPKRRRNGGNVPRPHRQPQGLPEFLGKHLFVDLTGVQQRIDHGALIRRRRHHRLFTGGQILGAGLLRQLHQGLPQVHRGSTRVSRSGFSPASSFVTKRPSSRTSLPSKKIRPPPCARSCRQTRSQWTCERFPLSASS